MNNKKFCFIICTNNPAYLEECLHYIQHLAIPEGYSTDFITVTGAESITSAYQGAMEQSDAKYKIYLHQDVFILNRRILADILSIFSSHEGIGMIGMVGYEAIAYDGIMWHMERLGALYQKEPEKPYVDYQEYQYSVHSDKYRYAAVADGFFMATAYDLPWNTTELDGFDFYDAFQCIEFLKRGYKIAIPMQRNPWCLHDDGGLPDLSQYDRYRQIFLKKYQNILGKDYRQIIELYSQERGGRHENITF